VRALGHQQQLDRDLGMHHDPVHRVLSALPDVFRAS
jgi:hypothetical protein